MKQKINWYKILFLIPLYTIVALLLILIFRGKRDIKRDILETRGYFKTDNLCQADKRYYETASEVLSVYSRLNREKRIIYIKETKKASDATGLPVWWGYGISYLETSFNDHGKHDYGEIGINGVKYDTALFAEFINKEYMPDHMRRKIPINIKTKKDLYDIKNSIRVTYTLLWFYYEHQFDGLEQWAVSVYHWGGFLSRHWKAKIIPESFRLNGIKYSVINYYLAWKEVVSCFERGRLEPLANIYSRYQKKKKKLSKKEITFRNAYRIIKGYERRIRKYEKAEIEFKGTIKDLKEYKKQAKKQLLKISGDAKRGKSKGMIARIKKVCREFYKKLGGNK